MGRFLQLKSSWVVFCLQHCASSLPMFQNQRKLQVTSCLQTRSPSVLHTNPPCVRAVLAVGRFHCSAHRVYVTWRTSQEQNPLTVQCYLSLVQSVQDPGFVRQWERTTAGRPTLLTKFKHSNQKNVTQKHFIQSKKSNRKEDDFARKPTVFVK